MIYIRKQTSQEIANITIVQGESIQLFGTQGYTVSQLQSIYLSPTFRIKQNWILLILFNILHYCKVFQF